ncbi:MAG: DUF423 domain-containing protein [Bosea sp. (in: a-proteobacteria)]
MITATRLHLFLAMLMGLAGVATLASAAHVAASTSLQTAGQMLLFHASLIVAATVARRIELLADTLARIAVSVLILGVVLFSGDLALRALRGAKLFAMAAPSGGILIMVGWVGLAFSALLARRR